MPSVLDALKEKEKEMRESGALDDDRLLKPNRKEPTKAELREREDEKQILVKPQPKSQGRIGGFEI